MITIPFVDFKLFGKVENGNLNILSDIFEEYRTIFMNRNLIKFSVVLLYKDFQSSYSHNNMTRSKRLKISTIGRV